MSEGRSILWAQGIPLTVELPADLVGRLAEVIAACNRHQWEEMRQQALGISPQPRSQSAIEALLGASRLRAADISTEGVALTLCAATATARHYREAQSVDPVWTGPCVLDLLLRRTDEALQDLIDAAHRSLLIASSTIYRIPAITEALACASERGVLPDICVEAPEPSGQRIARDTIWALGRDLQQRAEIHVWPRDRRPTDPSGKVGSLHAKCAVADEHLLFVSSANLTQYAMELNTELGTLIRGGRLPGIVATHFPQLIESGALRCVQT